MATLNSGRLVAFIALWLIALGSSGCGEAGGAGEGDTFYVYVVHGYAGGGELSVYGSAGPLATGLQYGEIGGDPEITGRVAPLEVDRRQFDGELQILLEGATEVATVTLDSFAFYPGETVTLFLTRRVGNNAYDLRVMRHNLLANAASPPSLASAPAANCVLEFNNGLSLSNVYTPSAYDVQLQWFSPTAPGDPSDPAMGDPSLLRSVYDSERDTKVETTCGAKTAQDFATASPATQSAINQAIAQRSAILAQIQSQPWYFATIGDSGYLEYRSARWDSPVGTGAQLVGWRSSREYQECVSGAIQVPVIADTNGAVTCDESLFNEAQADAVRLQECNRAITYPGISISPDSPRGQIFMFNTATDTCTYTFRLRTRNTDLIFRQGDGVTSQLAQFNVSFPRNSWHHFTLFGSPIDPLGYSLSSKENSQPLASIANPTGLPADTGSLQPAAPGPVTP